MYAIFQIGNKQYYVLTGQMIFIDRISASIGDSVVFNEVLLIKKYDDIKIGNPFIQHGKIIVHVLNHGLDRKVRIIKFNRRKHFQKCQGHRQCFTQIKIMKINDVFTINK